jgi:hypothetical protein
MKTKLEMRKMLKRGLGFKPRKFDMNILENKINNFELKDEKGNIISTNCNEIFFGGIKDGQQAAYFFPGMTEKVYCNVIENSLNFNHSGNPTWEFMGFMKEKGYSVNDSLIVWYRCCEDCLNELINLSEGKKTYDRRANTSCDFCKEVE